MKRQGAVLLQLSLPFSGVQDRVRAAAEAGRVVFSSGAVAAMDRFDISDILILRSMYACVMGLVRKGSNLGEWRCSILFTAKGFRKGGVIDLIISEGRAIVETIRWDETNE